MAKYNDKNAILRNDEMVLSQSVIVPTAIIYETGLSIEARGLFIMMCGQSEGSLESLRADADLSGEDFQDLLKELETYGWVGISRSQEGDVLEILVNDYAFEHRKGSNGISNKP